MTTENEEMHYYHGLDGRAVYTQDLVLHASGAETQDGQCDEVEVADFATARLKLHTTAISGNLEIIIETRFDGDDSWREVGRFDVVSATGVVRKNFAACDRYIRARWIVSSSATFALTGESI